MMNIKTCLTILICLQATSVFAEYKQPGEMTIEEQQMIRQTAAEYDECMNDYAVAQLQQQNDPRVIADHSMKHCASVLENLHNTLVESNYPPEFSQRYVSGISNRGANKLLANLMRYIATQQR